MTNNGTPKRTVDIPSSIQTTRTRDELETFHRGEHGDRRSHDPVPVEERDSEDAEEDYRRRHARDRATVGTHELEESEDPALTLVGEPQNPPVILQPDDEREGPENQREHAENVFGTEWHGVAAGEADPEGVQRARPDVAVDDPQRGRGEKEELPAARRDGVSNCHALGGRPRRRGCAHSSI